MAGRKPKPAWLKIVTGNPGRRSMAKEPTPKVLEKYPPPAELNENERKHWRAIVEPMSACKAISVADLYVVAEASRVAAKLDEIRVKVGSVSPIILSPNKFPIYNPLWSAEMALQKRLLDFLRELGMTPASRTRVSKMEDPNEKDPFAAFAQGAGNEDDELTEQ